MGTQVSCSSPHHSSTPVRNSLLGASLHSFCSTRVVPNLTAKLQGHRGVAFIHCQDGHLVLGGALNHSQGADLRLKAKVMVSAACGPQNQTPHGSPYSERRAGSLGTTALGTGERRDTARGVRWYRWPRGDTDLVHSRAQYLVVVAELQRVPLPITHTPRQVRAHHRAGLPCRDRDKCCRKLDIQW